MAPRRLTLGGSRESVTPWLAAPMLGLVLLIVAIMQVPGHACEDRLLSFYDDAPERNLVVGLTVVLALLLAVAAAHCWAVQRRRDGLAVPPVPEAWVALAVVLGAAALILVPPLRGPFTVAAIAGSVAAVVGFFAVLDMQVNRVELRRASFYLPLYYAATAFFLYPLLALVSLHFTAHPFCGFD